MASEPAPRSGPADSTPGPPGPPAAPGTPTPINRLRPGQAAAIWGVVASAWAVALSDDCDACGMGEPRVVLTVEEVGRAGLGLVAHLAPSTTRRLRAALAAALKEIGEDPGP